MSGVLETGTEIAGFRIQSLIGRGGMGVVYLAEQAVPHRKVALKLLAPELSGDPAFRERFGRESDAAASIDHPNVIPIYGAGEADGILFIAMRYVEGTDLAALIRQEGPVAPGRVAAIVSQVASALDAAHQRGLVHRDVKPGNVLIARGPRAPEHVYLTDFGVIKRHELTGGITKTGQFMGSLDYVAPEQIRGEAVDGRSDVYSLGCLLFECLTGKPPFASDLEVTVLYGHLEEPPPSVTAHRPDLPATVDQVVAKGMAKKPEDRYASAGELAAELRAALGPEASSGPHPQPARARRLRALVGVGVLVAAGVDAGALLLPRHHSTVPATTERTSPAVSATAYVVERIDPRTNRVFPVIRGTEDALYGVAVGEGAVWGIGRSGLTILDPNTGTTKSLALSYSPSDITLGFGAVWVQEGKGAFTFPHPLQRIDPALDEIVKTINVPTISGVAVATGDGGVWVASSYPHGWLSRIDPITNRVVRTVRLPASSVNDVAVGGNEVWVTDDFGNQVMRIDPSTMRVIATIPLDSTPYRIATGLGAAWVVSEANGTVAEIDYGTTSVARYIGVGSSPVGVAVGDGAVWVADSPDWTVARLDPVTGDVRYIHLGRHGDSLSAIAIDLRSGQVWVTRAPPGTPGA